MKGMGRVLLMVLAMAGGTPPARAADPVPVMILDGESAGPYHDWRQTTPLLRAQLEETGRFTVDVVTAPAAGADLETFRPDFSRYAAVILNYDAPDGRWPASLMAAFERYVAEGGGFVAVHAADNAFPGWVAYNAMTGVGGWRGRAEQSGPFWYLSNGSLVSEASPGLAGRHGARLPFLVTLRAEHPVTAGLPRTWMHAGDELYSHLRGPGGMTVLASAWSDPANNGSGRDEPVLMANTFGKGRVFHTTLGHDVAAMRSVGFEVTFQRGVEWAATGQVRQPLPDDFPTPREPRLRDAPAAGPGAP